MEECYDADYKTKLDYLSSYQWRMRDIDVLRSRIEDMEEKIRSLEDRLTGIPAQQISDMPKGGKPRDMGDLIGAKLNLMETLKKNQAMYQHDLMVAEVLKANVYRYVRSADNIRDRTLLAMHYVDGMSYARMAEVLGYSSRQIKRICKNAVENLQNPPECH